ncbi:ionotropic receptor 25a-like [Centruroides sculpturatus]|uniref:ionotropic receptor 25a-like n=1 Tax=Centruroides sculpturatus TaxID=218467 RepID=UPI000C6D9313|nr:ionotropic receptor 25a-like [Centruroides sculpturatus]
MKIRLKLSIFLLTFGILSSNAQDKEGPDRRIKIVVITEKGFTIPTAAITDSHYVDYGELETEEIELEENNNEKEVCEHIFDGKEPPTVVIDATRRPRGMDNRISPTVKAVVRKMGVPTVSATYGYKLTLMGWESLSATEKEYLVHIAPPGDVIPFAVRDICEIQKFKSAGILYYKELVMDLKYSTLLENIPTKHIIQLIENDENDIRTKIQRMKPPEIANFFVIGSNSVIEKALRMANNLNLYGNQFSWYFITTENQEPDCHCKNMTSLLLKPIAKKQDRLEWIMRKLPKYSSDMEATFYFDLGDFVAKTVRDMIKKGNWPEKLDYPECSDMTLTEEMKEQRGKIRLMTTLKQLSFDGTFGKFMFTSSANYEEIELSINKLTFYNNKRQREGKSVIGKWIAGKDSGRLQFEKGESLSKYTAVTMYRVTTIIQPPFIYKVNNSGSIEYVGYCIDLLNEIKKILKFEYTIFETEDGKFGAMNEKGEWNGMIKDLKDRKAEIALGPISVMAERETVVDFTVPYYDLVGITILMKKTKVASSLFKFLTVLENKVWGCILAAYFFTSFLMYLFDRLSPYSFHNNREKYKDDEENRDFTAKECLWFCMTSLTPQGGGEAPRNLSGRLVAATWWLFGFIIIASYTANLAAFLTVSRLDSPIEGLDDLAKQYKIKYAPQNDTSSMTYFERRAYIEDLFYE